MSDSEKEPTASEFLKAVQKGSADAALKAAFDESLPAETPEKAKEIPADFAGIMNCRVAPRDEENENCGVGGIMVKEPFFDAHKAHELGAFEDIKEVLYARLNTLDQQGFTAAQTEWLQGVLASFNGLLEHQNTRIDRLEIGAAIARGEIEELPPRRESLRAKPGEGSADFLDRVRKSEKQFGHEATKIAIGK